MRELAKKAYLVLNKLLARFGLRLVKASAPPRSASDFFEHVKLLGFQPSLVIDVGVADGTLELYRAFPESRYLLVEPNKDFEPVLKRLCSQLKADYIIAAAAEEEGVIEFNVHDDLFGSSMLDEVEGVLADGQRHRVRSARLDQLIPDDVGRGILLKVDVQGAELKVIEGATNRLPDIDIVILETALISSMVGGPELWDVIEYMRNKGFVVYDILGGVLRPLDHALKQVDLVFIKEGSPLRSDRRYATPEQRRRLNEAAKQRWRSLAGRTG